jgi:hypothetical protein
MSRSFLNSGTLIVIIFLLSLKTLLYAYTENTLNGEISTESVYISDNNNTNLKTIDSFYLHYMG